MQAGHLGVRRRAAVGLMAGAVVLIGAAVMTVDQRPDRVTPVAGRPVGESASPASRSGGPSPSGSTTAVDPAHLRLSGSPTGAAVAPPARGPVVRAADVLRAWDKHRAQAWAEGDVAGLRELYVDRAGVADVRLLRRYADRGYRVEGLTTQLLAVDVLERRPGRWLLRVTDRLARAVAVRGAERVPLPRDREDTHVVALVRGTDGRWRVAEVRAA